MKYVRFSLSALGAVAVTASLFSAFSLSSVPVAKAAFPMQFGCIQPTALNQIVECWGKAVVPAGDAPRNMLYVVHFPPEFPGVVMRGINYPLGCKQTQTADGVKHLECYGAIKKAANQHLEIQVDFGLHFVANCGEQKVVHAQVGNDYGFFALGGTETVVLNAPACPPAPTPAPYGHLDGAVCPANPPVLIGWACDPSNFNVPLKVHVYRDGGPGQGVFIGEVLANQPREAGVAQLCGGNSHHGFHFVIPENLRNDGHQYYAYAIDINGAGTPVNISNTQLNGSGQWAACPRQTPVGYADTTPICKEDGLYLQGWTCDASNFSAPVTVHVYRDGPAGQGTFVGQAVANLQREAAVGALCGGNVHHGYVFKVPDNLRNDGHQYFVHPLDIDAAGTVVPNASNPQLPGSGVWAACPVTQAPPRFSAIKTAPANIRPGEKLVYTVTVRNDGAATASVQLLDNVPAPIIGRFSPALSTLGCSIPNDGNNRIHCPVESYAPGQSRTYTLAFDLLPGTACNTVIRNVADISANGSFAWSNPVETRVVCDSFPISPIFPPSSSSSSSSAHSSSSSAPAGGQCSDGIDNDNDGWIDHFDLRCYGFTATGFRFLPNGNE